MSNIPFDTLQAVKKSRVKSKMRTQQTLERVNQLKMENELLEEKIKMLNKELGFLKDLFLAHAGNTSIIIHPQQLYNPRLSDCVISTNLPGSNQHSANLQDVDLNALLAEDTKDNLLRS